MITQTERDESPSVASKEGSRIRDMPFNARPREKLAQLGPGHHLLVQGASQFCDNAFGGCGAELAGQCRAGGRAGDNPD